MSKKTFKKKVIVTANFGGLNETETTEKAEGYGTAMKANPDIVAGIKPTAVELLEKVGNVKSIALEYAEIVKSLKSKTEEFHIAQQEVKDIIVNQWVGQVQTACGDDTKSIKLLGFGIKGDDNSTSDDVIGKAVESFPIINSITSKAHLIHVLDIKNSETCKRRLPKDAKQTNIYGQIGGTTAPNDVTKMINLGIASKGKYTQTFDPADFGKPVYYIPAYISKKR